MSKVAQEPGSQVRDGTQPRQGVNTVDGQLLWSRPAPLSAPKSEEALYAG